MEQKSEKSLFQDAVVTLSTSFSPPDAIDIDASVRLYFGKQDIQEYLTYRLTNVQYNPINSNISLTGDDSDVSFQGRLDEGRLAGSWKSKSLGSGGEFEASKHEKKPPADHLTQIKSLRDTYFGSFTNTDLPPKAQQ